MQVKSIAECFKGSILQYFQPTLSYHLSLRTLVLKYLFLTLSKYIHISMYSIMRGSERKPIAYRVNFPGDC